jgi:hypothetical protein
MRTKCAIATLLLAFALAFLASASAVHRQATAEVWPSGCSCWYFCAGNPPLDPKDPPGTVNTKGTLPYLSEECIQALNCQVCLPLP